MSISLVFSVPYNFSIKEVVPKNFSYSIFSNSSKLNNIIHQLELRFTIFVQFKQQDFAACKGLRCLSTIILNLFIKIICIVFLIPNKLFKKKLYFSILKFNVFSQKLNRFLHPLIQLFFNFLLNNILPEFRLFFKFIFYISLFFLQFSSHFCSWHFQILQFLSRFRQKKLEYRILYQPKTH